MNPLLLIGLGFAAMVALTKKPAAKRPVARPVQRRVIRRVAK
jgi:hypothetical protein